VAAGSGPQRARERFLQRFTIDRVVDQMLGFYDRALAGSANGRATGAATG
jgi:hypothetical protein